MVLNYILLIICLLPLILGMQWKDLLVLESKLISDTEDYLSIESMIRRWISIIFKAYAEANNKFLKAFVPKKPRSYTIYLETNNLYSHSMMQLLPNEILD